MSDLLETAATAGGPTVAQRPRIGIVVFPGTNCEFDVAEAVERVGGEATVCWHGDASLGNVDAVVVPGGFAHGDYLRPGAIARFSPVMKAVTDFAQDGGAVVGICNGFQVLTEAGLLPGALIKNSGLRFSCRMVEIEVTSNQSPLTAHLPLGKVLRIPINHFEGNYRVDPAELPQLVANDQVIFRYLMNPNGSIDGIAGVSSPHGNVVGLMPHPERALSDMVGSADGLTLWEGLVQFARQPRRAEQAV